MIADGIEFVVQWFNLACLILMWCDLVAEWGHVKIIEWKVYDFIDLLSCGSILRSGWLLMPESFKMYYQIFRHFKKLDLFCSSYILITDAAKPFVSSSEHFFFLECFKWIFKRLLFYILLVFIQIMILLSVFIFVNVKIDIKWEILYGWKFYNDLDFSIYHCKQVFDLHCIFMLKFKYAVFTVVNLIVANGTWGIQWHIIEYL